MHPPKFDVFNALADPTRRRILELLVDREYTVTQLVEPFRMTQPAISQHLRVLRVANLVSAEQRGRERYYRLQPEGLQPAFDWLAHYEQFWSSRLSKLKTYLKRIQ